MPPRTMPRGSRQRGKVMWPRGSSNIPVRSDKALIQILSQLDIDQHIPPELYKAVAEILAFVYSANEKYREQQEKSV
jgi:flagellar biosynthesis protein